MHYSVYSEISEQGTGGEGTEIFLPLTLGQEGGGVMRLQIPSFGKRLYLFHEIVAGAKKRGQKKFANAVCGLRRFWTNMVQITGGGKHLDGA